MAHPPYAAYCGSNRARAGPGSPESYTVLKSRVSHPVEVLMVQYDGVTLSMPHSVACMKHGGLLLGLMQGIATQASCSAAAGAPSVHSLNYGGC